MKKLIITLLIILILAQPVSAMEFVPPNAPETVETLVPNETSSFAEDLLFVIKSAVKNIKPEIGEALKVCLTIVSISLLTSILAQISSSHIKVTNLVAVTALGVTMLHNVNSMVGLGASTIEELSDYGKLLLPVMTAALAAQGGVSASTSLYAGTAFFSTMLISLITKVLIPVLYLYMCCCIANHAIGEEILKRICKFMKWLITWSLKIILYIFTGYITITGVISGSVDATAVKATKITISGFVPVIGNILADASETIILSAGLMKNSAGVYGILVFVAILIGPFLKIATQYCMLKVTSAVSGVFSEGQFTGLIHDFSSCMGFVLAMTGTVCLLFMISIICFMKGVS